MPAEEKEAPAALEEPEGGDGVTFDVGASAAGGDDGEMDEVMNRQ